MSNEFFFIVDNIKGSSRIPLFQQAADSGNMKSVIKATTETHSIVHEELITVSENPPVGYGVLAFKLIHICKEEGTIKKATNLITVNIAPTDEGVAIDVYFSNGGGSQAFTLILDKREYSVSTEPFYLAVQRHFSRILSFIEGMIVYTLNGVIQNIRL